MPHFRALFASLGTGALTAALLLAAPAAGAKEALGAFGDWAAFRDGAEGKCYIVSPPSQTRTSAKGVRRGAAALGIGIWPGRGVGGQVHAATGFGIDAARPVTLKVGSRSFTLLPEGESAWAESAGADQSIIESLRRGSAAEVSSTSARGTEVTDRYSLKGFSAALDAARSACGGKSGAKSGD